MWNFGFRDSNQRRVRADHAAEVVAVFGGADVFAGVAGLFEAFLDAQARLARLLLELEKQEQEKGYITISQDELARRTGLIRQTVAKALGKWRRAGWLITGRGRILILNRKALEELETSLPI